MADTRRRGVFADSDAVRVADVDELIVENNDQPKELSKRRVTGERQRVSMMERVLLSISAPWFWELVEDLEQLTLDSLNVGRPRLHTVADWAVFVVAAEVAGGLNRAEDLLGDPVNWQRARDVIAAQRRFSAQQQLSAVAINRFQFRRFRDRYVSETTIKELHGICRDCSVQAAETIGCFDESKGSRTRPHPSCVVYGDGTIIKTMFNQRQQRVDPSTGEITYSRHDPDGRYHHQHNKSHHTGTDSECDYCTSQTAHHGTASLDKPLSYEAVHASVRTLHPEERIILDSCITNDDQTEATVFTDMILDLIGHHPNVAVGLRAVAYDMALHSVDHDRLQDAGIIVVTKVPLDPGRKIKQRVLGAHDFKLTDGTNANTIVHTVDGTPCLRVFDGDSHEFYLRLERINTQINRQKTKQVLYTRWRVPEHPLAAHMANATVRIRHNSTAQERQNNQRRSKHLRAIPESDACYGELFGMREDSESINSQIKAGLPNGRARSVGRVRNSLNLMIHQMVQNDKAVYAYCQRTGDEEAFAKHFKYRPPPRGRPALKAA